MKYLMIFVLLIWSTKIFSQKFLDSNCIQLDSIEIRLDLFETNRKVILTYFDSKDSILLEFMTNKDHDYADIKISTDKIYRNNTYKIYLWIKRRFWFGYKEVVIVGYCTQDRNLYIYNSNVHKYKYRFVYDWVYNYPFRL